MDENIIEQKVGDILIRKRIAKDALDGNKVAYGPITLQPTEDGLLPTDFDGRVYEHIELDDNKDQEEQVNHIVTQADNVIKQLFDEL